VERGRYTLRHPNTVAVSEKLETWVGTVQWSRDHIVQLLKDRTLLGGLPDDVLHKLIAAGQQRAYLKGQVIFRSGEPGDHALVVLSGQLKILNTTEDGREIGLNFVAAGDLVGEVAVLDGRERAANVVALEDSVVFAIFRRELLPMLLSHPVAMMEIVEALCEKLRIATSIIEDNALEMKARLAKALIRLAHQHGVKRSKSILINLELSQTELGNYAGLSRANVSRQLAQFRAVDILAFDGPKIVVLDAEKLDEIARSARDS
jgi:CRP/FNR family transcriptional regulator, cyclic AMP receptor protein